VLRSLRYDSKHCLMMPSPMHTSAASEHSEGSMPVEQAQQARASAGEGSITCRKLSTASRVVWVRAASVETDDREEPQAQRGRMGMGKGVRVRVYS
jgi:hypothetical protein